MGFRFRKSIKIAPGVRINVSNKSIGVSAGVKGLRYSVNSRGKKTATASIPGTGISYSKSLNSLGCKNYKSPSYRKNSKLKYAYENTKAKEQELERNKLEVELFENKLDMIKSIHIECDEQVDWEEVRHRVAPFDAKDIGPNEKQALIKLKQYTPSVMDRIFKKSEAKLKQIQSELVEAKNIDHKEYDEWKRMIDIANRVCDGDIDAYLEVIGDFAPLDDLVEFGSEFEFFIDSKDVIEVDFKINSEKVVPNEVKTLTKAGKISTKPMSKSKFYDIQQDYVCSCSLRIARDMFALLPVKSVLINAIDNRLNTETGNYKDVTILSAKIDKLVLSKINMELVDPSDSMNNFIHNMKFKKTKGFEEVEKIILG